MFDLTDDVENSPPIKKPMLVKPAEVKPIDKSKKDVPKNDVNNEYEYSDKTDEDDKNW